MSIDTTFHPLTETYAVDNTAPVQIPGAGQRGVTTFRVRAITANGYISWAQSAALATSKGAPTIGNPVVNTLGCSTSPHPPHYIELPPGTFFIGDKAFATSSFEITGGIGGTGG